MTTKYGFALHELHFVEDGEKVAVAANSTAPLTEDVFNEFVALNAVRYATKDEIAAAKAREFPGVTKTTASPSATVTKGEAKGAAAEAAKGEQKKSDAKASAAVAAESDRNREAAKQAAAAKPADDDKADAKPAADDEKSDPLA